MGDVIGAKSRAVGGRKKQRDYCEWGEETDLIGLRVEINATTQR